jgi:hypothetical protein
MGNREWGIAKRVFLQIWDAPEIFVKRYFKKNHQKPIRNQVIPAKPGFLTFLDLLSMLYFSHFKTTGLFS